MKKVKAVLIDVENKEVKEVEIENSLDGYYHALKCTCVTVAMGYLFSPIHHVMFVDDEGLLAEKPLGAFSIGGSQVFSGNGLIMGLDSEGDTICHSINISAISAEVRFRDVSELPESGFTVISR